MIRARAHDELMAALAGAFTALQDPALLRSLGPSVQGGTRPGGARVPGTSFEFTLEQAAPRMRLLLGDAGPVLAAADFSARQAVLDGLAPPCMGEVFDRLAGLEPPASGADDASPPPAGIAARYHAAVAALYPPKQQPLVQGLFSDPEALDAMPVQAFMAALVRHG
ncbi:MAG: hypothetical protein RLZZ393_1114 [Pseudomonadota bacterium]|jgi:hypothetical protein